MSEPRMNTDQRRSDDVYKDYIAERDKLTRLEQDNAARFDVYLAIGSLVGMVIASVAAQRDAVLFALCWGSFFLTACLVAVGMQLTANSAADVRDIMDREMSGCTECYFNRVRDAQARLKLPLWIHRLNWITLLAFACGLAFLQALLAAPGVAQ